MIRQVSRMHSSITCAGSARATGNSTASSFAWARRSMTSFEILSRIEQRYRLVQGYFKANLPHQSRSLYDHDMGDISAAERRRLAWHLPGDFSSLPFSKREEIIEWVRRFIISGSTDYRRYQAAAIKQRYAIRFPGVTYGGRALSPRSQINPDSTS